MKLGAKSMKNDENQLKILENRWKTIKNKQKTMKNDRKSLKIIAKSGHGTKKTLKNIEKSTKIVGRSGHPGLRKYARNMREICAELFPGSLPGPRFSEFRKFRSFLLILASCCKGSEPRPWHARTPLCKSHLGLGTSLGRGPGQAKTKVRVKARISCSAAAAQHLVLALALTRKQTSFRLGSDRLTNRRHESA